MTLPVYEWPRDRELTDLRERLVPSDDGIPAHVEASARSIIAAVRERGDAALIELTAKFDRVELEPDALRIDPRTIAENAEKAPSELRAAMDKAIANIRRFHGAQLRRDIAVSGDGEAILELLWRPVARAALYVPGGRAAYPTSVMMNAIPAQVAGVGRIAVFTVPGTVENNPAVAYALHALELEEVYRVAGAQAIAAAAYGTESIAPVDVIVGPGNAYVAAAKREVYGRVGIDSIAGPSEVLILADDSADPRYVAYDLLAQAEHDPLARCVIASTSRALLDAVETELQTVIAASPRREIVEAAWKNHGLRILAPDVPALIEICNQMAPEHLQVILEEPPDPRELVAGAIFVGNDAPTAIGDYIAGPNHVLPTGGAARFSGPLGVHVFVRPTSVVRGTRQMMAELGRKGALIADYEELAGHAAALRARTQEGS